ncbi:MAG: class I SAM-dependent methyltransferase [Thermoanaerobaculia bacterium]
MATEGSYTVGHKEGALACMRFRTAERSCAFFRHHIRSASRILDCGCGPGSITVGLAQWAPDGETVGIDLGAEQLDGARALARELGVKNVAFRQGSIFDLPFADDSFDVVFSQTVLFHVSDPEKALAEIKRVLRPGGLVALRDAINGSIMIWPDDPLVREIGRMVRLGAQRSGGNPDVGRELGTLLHSSGFSDVFFTLGFEQPERPEERAEYFSVVAGVLEGDLTSLGVSEGWSTAEKLAQGAARCRDLAKVPGSIWALPFGQAVGRKPS